MAPPCCHGNQVTSGLHTLSLFINNKLSILEEKSCSSAQSFEKQCFVLASSHDGGTSHTTFH